MESDRILARYDGQEAGPLLIALGGIHGNEQAGVQAILQLHHMLLTEPDVNPGFTYHGSFLGILGNQAASITGQRFICQDLNRMFTEQRVAHIRDQRRDSLQAEEREMHDLIQLIEGELAERPPERLIVMDLHTTTADGGIFCITSDDPESIWLGVSLHAPVITGMLKGLEGTTMHYFQQSHFTLPLTAISFESGQHNDPLSVSRAVSAMISCMRAVGSVEAKDVEHHHDEILRQYSADLPKVANLRYVHRMHEGDGFEMKPGYSNFQQVHQGEVLAYDLSGPIMAEEDGLILMPHYQPQGNDGFFLIHPEVW